MPEHAEVYIENYNIAYKRESVQECDARIAAQGVIADKKILK